MMTFLLSQKNTEEQNTQHSTETLSQPISQNLTATFSSNALWTLYAGGLLWARNCAQKCSVNSVRSVREKTPQRVSQLFFFSQKNTDEQNTQRRTETLSQPISQNLTAIFSWNVLWYLYAGGLLWVRNCAQKGSVKSVSSVREQNIHHERKECLLWEKKLPSVKEKPSHAPHKQASRGNLTYYAPPCGGGVGGGATIL